MPPAREEPIRLIAAVAAQGGLVQAACLLRALPQRCPPVLILQRSPAWSGDYLRKLSAMSGRGAVVGADGMALDRGAVAVLDGRSEVAIEHDGDGMILRVEAGDARRFSACADLLFRSVAEATGGAAAGIALSGEGASGLAALAQAGGLALSHNKNALLRQPRGLCRGAVIEMSLEDMACAIGGWL